jgi:hypothetical protein
MFHVWGRGEVYLGFAWGNLRERDHFEDLNLDDDNIKTDIQETRCGRGLY